MHPLNPLTWLRWFKEFVQCWFLGIPWRDAPKAIPAIILTIVLFTTGFIAFNGGTGWRNRLLNRQFQVALERDDFPTAEIVVRRQLEAAPTDVDLMYRFGLVRQNQGFEEECKSVMQRLLTRRHLPAAKWLLEYKIIDRKLTDFEPEELEEAGRVLKLITENEPKNLGIKRLYANYLVYEKRFPAAIVVLDELSEFDPVNGLATAALARQIQDYDAAERFALRALERVEEMKKDDPANAILAMRIAQNQIFLDRHSDAIRTLRRGIDIARTSEDRRMLTQGLGDAIVAYVNYIEKTPTNTVQDRLRVLNMLAVAVQIAPNNPRVIGVVADHVLNSLDETDTEITSVRTALVSGSPTGIAHFIKGTAALMKGDQESAELHLELAVEQMPRSGAIMNNLAVALAQKQPPELERALKVANAAIENVPTPTPHFYETRGQILYLLGRFRESISDLERALREPALAVKAHEMLAVCYDKVGDAELAADHRLAAQQTKQDNEASQGDKQKTPG